VDGQDTEAVIVTPSAARAVLGLDVVAEVKRHADVET
jgi:hypothetical protein